MRQRYSYVNSWRAQRSWQCVLVTSSSTSVTPALGCTSLFVAVARSLAHRESSSASFARARTSVRSHLFLEVHAWPRLLPPPLCSWHSLIARVSRISSASIQRCCLRLWAIVASTQATSLRSNSLTASGSSRTAHIGPSSLSDSPAACCSAACRLDKLCSSRATRANPCSLCCTVHLTFFEEVVEGLPNSSMGHILVSSAF
mmetsp:Transcript_113670/g.316555  ORF Transcript_113670/g.316555 Transcript_113670/m.316555 type:complete len:201 (+) Transcript_113670:1473-2075(+)